jgi:hypothetical protein
LDPWLGFQGVDEGFDQDRFNLALRHDVPDSQDKQQEAWKGVKIGGGEVLAACWAGVNGG